MMNDERQTNAGGPCPRSLRFIIHHSSFIVKHLFPSLAFTQQVRILLGYMKKVKQIFLLGARPYELVEVEGPIFRENRCFPAQFDHDAGMLRISKTVPVEQRAWVVAVAVADACFLMWKPLPVIWPVGWLDDPGGWQLPGRGAGDDPPDR
jgi:hypothetical protein